MAPTKTDGRTSYFASTLDLNDRVKILAEFTGCTEHKIAQIYNDHKSERYMDYFQRIKNGHQTDTTPLLMLLSQGYKQGLRWRELPLGKTAWDICIYQQILQELKPQTIIELGTGLGASSLFLLDQCKTFNCNTKIITMDENSDEVAASVHTEPDIKFIKGDIMNIAALLPDDQLEKLPKPWLIIEDCHEHTSFILKYFEHRMNTGDYMIVEDKGLTESGKHELCAAMMSLNSRSLFVDTYYTDLFGRNVTCAPDSIFRKMEN